MQVKEEETDLGATWSVGTYDPFPSGGKRRNRRLDAEKHRNRIIGARC